MRKTTVLVLAFVALLTSVPQGFASSPAEWSKLWQQASAACVKASELKKAKAGPPVDFSDKVLVMVDGHWPQPHMKNAPARFACLYDKRSRTAEAHEAAR